VARRELGLEAAITKLDKYQRTRPGREWPDSDTDSRNRTTSTGNHGERVTGDQMGRSRMRLAKTPLDRPRHRAYRMRTTHKRRIFFRRRPEIKRGQSGL